MVELGMWLFIFSFWGAVIYFLWNAYIKHEDSLTDEYKEERERINKIPIFDQDGNRNTIKQENWKQKYKKDVTDE